MAKKKGTAAGAVDLATFRGQTFCVAGKLAGWNADRQIAELAALRGGKVVKAVDGKLSYLITGRTGFAGPKKQAEKLNAQGKALFFGNRLRFLEIPCALFGTIRNPKGERGDCAPRAQ